MPMQVCMGAQTMCTMGIGPSVFNVLPKNKVFTNQMPDANIMDNVPIVNIVPFPMCNSIANPIVAAATAAKLGVFTPAACLPNIPGPWIPGAPTVMLGSQPTLDNTCQLMCAYGGVITFVTPGEVTVMVP
jgi:hypothetical protein